MKTAIFVLNVLGFMTTSAASSYDICPDIKNSDGVVDKTLSCGNHFFAKPCTNKKGKKCTLKECQDLCDAHKTCTTINFKTLGACKLFHNCVGSRAYTGEGVTYSRKISGFPAECPGLKTTTAPARVETEDEEAPTTLRSTRKHHRKTRTVGVTTTIATTPSTTTPTTPSTPAATLPPTPAPICPQTCLGMSCDEHILGPAKTSCAFLESGGCDCQGCKCPMAVTVPPTTPTTRNLTFAFTWTIMEGRECGVRNGSLLMSNVVHIGETGKDFDRHITPDDCKIKCAESEECGGFTYHRLRRFCRYKHRQPGLGFNWLKSKYVTCYVYNQPIADDSSAVGARPLTEEEIEEELEMGIVAVVVIIVVLVMLTLAVGGVFFVIKRRKSKGAQVVVVRGLLVSETENGDAAQTV